MRKNRYEEIVSRFVGRRLVVVGDLMTDRYITGQVNRISPESPTMVVEVESETRVPGGAANVVNNLRALGARVAIAGVIGDDEEGRRLKADLESRGVDVSGIVTDPSRPTTVKERILAQNRQLLRVDYERKHPIEKSVETLLQTAVSRALDDAEAILVSDYDKGVLTEELGAWIVATARSQGRMSAANPKPATAHRMRGAEVLSVNQAEAERLAGVRFGDEDVLEAEGARLARTLDVGALIVTRGAKGLALWKRRRDSTLESAQAAPETRAPSASEAMRSLWRPRGESARAAKALQNGGIEIMRRVPAHPVEVYDVAGAGDTAVSALTLALLGGADIVEAAIMANHAAACVVRKVGVATVSPEELLADWRDS